MTKTVYYEIDFVTLHQKIPADLPSPSASVYLSVNGVKTSSQKYGLDFGFGDPGENPAFDSFDYPEFRIGGIFTAKPADYSAQSTYQSEGSGGSTHTNTFRKYASLSVPDDFVIPPDLYKGTGGVTFAGLTGTTITFSDPAYNISTSAVGAVSFGDFKLATTDNALVIAQNALTAAGLGSLAGTIANAAEVRSALTAIQSGGLDLIQYGFQNFDTLSAAKFDGLVDAYLKGAAAQALSTLDHLVLVPGDAAADKLAHKILESANMISTLQTAGTASATGTIGLTVDFAGVASLTASVTASTRVDVVIAGTGDTSLQAAGPVSYLIGGSGANTFRGASGREFMAGGDGNDTFYIGAGSSSFIDGGGGDDTIIDAQGDETILGGDGKDVVVFAGNDSLYTVIKNASGSVVVTGKAGAVSDSGTKTLSAVETLRFSNKIVSTDNIMPSGNGAGFNAGIAYQNGSTGQGGAALMDGPSSGGPTYLRAQYIYFGSDNLAISTEVASVFVHTGSGTDAIQVSSGQNVLDGGTGSNFLTGGSGSGSDTFFTDARGDGVVWNTLRNFHAGDAATLWGFVAGVSSYRWEQAITGAAGYEGATLRANIVGGGGRSGDGIDASITFAGLSVAQAQKLQVATGTQPAGSYLYLFNPGV